MHFVIHCLDKAGANALRLSNYDKHKAYLAAPIVDIVISGPLLANDGETMIGSLFVVEARDLAMVKKFNTDDPFFHAGVWEKIEIHPFSKRMDNRAAPAAA